MNPGRSHKLHAARIKPSHPQRTDSWQQDENSPDLFKFDTSSLFSGWFGIINFRVIAGACIRNFLVGVHKALRLAGARLPCVRLLAEAGSKP